MASKKKIFEEFFYEKNNQICDIEKITNYVDTHNDDYSPYRGYMLCPECQRAKLTFVHKTSKRRAHLKKIPSSQHLEDCSYNFDYASKKLVSEYVESLNYNEVQDKLNALMNMLCNKKSQRQSFSDGNELSIVNSNPILIPDVIKEPDNLKALRRKRLSGWIDKEFGTDLHIFYGRVMLSVRENQKIRDDGSTSIYYFLELKGQNSKGDWKYRTSIYRAGKRDDIDEDKIYQIAAIGMADFSKKWWRINLINKDALLFREVKE